MIFSDVTGTVGRTPMVELGRLAPRVFDDARRRLRGRQETVYREWDKPAPVVTERVADGQPAILAW